MKTLAIMQPHYLPWLGYFQLMSQADIFVIYDHVQFSKQTWQQRNRIRNKNGEILLSVPVVKDSHSRICDVKINAKQAFLEKHLKSIEHSYSKMPFYSEWFPKVEKIYQQKYETLLELNMSLIELGRTAFNVRTPLFFSSKLEVVEGRVESLVHLCKQFSCERYLSPVGARDYIEENNIFAENGIILSYQEFQHPIYAQKGADDFISHLSFLDYLFNSGGNAPFLIRV